MEVESKYTTIRISKELRKRLAELKLRLDMRTYEDVIVHLLDSSRSERGNDLNSIIEAVQDFCRRHPEARFYPQLLARFYESRLSTRAKELLAALTASKFEVRCSELDKSINELIKFVHVTEYVRQTTQK